MEDENFSVYGVTHKFTPNFDKKNSFVKCHALFMTTVSPPLQEPSLILSRFVNAVIEGVIQR